ncbi:MAG TPA: TQO small subunit DoxD [Ignavibacteria bacterium]|jgi:uncharacterized membrane protein YphA (DoxX/SURF4 family)
MGLLFKARGSSSIGILFIRIIVGAYTLSLGIMQASNIELYISKIKAMNIVSENTAFIAGFVFPFLLIIFGSLYIMGFFTPTTSLVLGLISLIKIAGRGLFPAPGIPFNKDLIFFACFLLTFFSGAGRVSFDALLDRKKKVVVKDAPKPQVVTAEVVTEKKSEEIPPS